MIVEDDANVVITLRLVLENLGYEVSARRPNLEKLKPWNLENKPELIQLDGLEGQCFDFYEVLKSDNPDSNIFICSGSIDFEPEAKERGIHFIHKDSNYVDKIVEYVTPFIKK